MYAALTWIPRGVAKEKLPQGVDEDDEMDDIREDGNASMAEANDNDKATASDAPDEEEEDSEVDIEKILSNDLNNLTFHKKNDDDPYLKADPKAKELFDEEELEDLVLRETDALIVAVKSGEDVSTLEVHVFDDDPEASDDEDGAYVPHTYVHHDIVLPVLPLCTAYTCLKVEEEQLNLVAVGMFTPGIDIWDVDRVNNLEPVTSLGGYDTKSGLSSALSAAEAVRNRSKSKKKKKPKLRLKDGSHTDAVMCLGWNNVQREYLVSGSADCTVKVWDVESSHCAQTLKHHSDKVQSVNFHPNAAETLITGSFDKTVQLVDVRSGEAAMCWSVGADVESCQWGNGPTGESIVVSTEDGAISVFDARVGGSSKKKKGCLTRWNAHNGAATAFAISQSIPGMMVSGGVDKMVKVWDISEVMNGKPGDMVYERTSKAGALFSLSLCPVGPGVSSCSPFVTAFGGAQGCLKVVDLGVESEAVRNRFLQHCSKPASQAIMKRAARGKQAKLSKSMNVDNEESSSSSAEGNSDDEGQGSSDSDSDHSLQ